MKGLRSLIRLLLRRSGYDIRRYVTECGQALPMLDLAVHSHLAQSAAFYFLQIGANDGEIDDHLRPLVRRFGLKGLLVEPLADAFTRLRANYADQPQVAFENCALWTEDGEREFYRIRPAAYANPLVRGMAGLSREALMGASRYLPGLEENIECLRVRTLSARSLLAKHAVTRIDLLMVDTEGLDDHMIRLVLEQVSCPALIHYEHIHLSPDRQDVCARYLADRGYRFARNRTDTLAMLAGD